MHAAPSYANDKTSLMFSNCARNCHAPPARAARQSNMSIKKIATKKGDYWWMYTYYYCSQSCSFF